MLIKLIQVSNINSSNKGEIKNNLSIFSCWLYTYSTTYNNIKHSNLMAENKNFEEGDIIAFQGVEGAHSGYIRILKL